MKNDMQKNPLLSIVTVVRNCEDALPDFFSRFHQIKNKHFVELIIVDGASIDNTVDVIRHNESVISKWISEPDEGIYDAMNKGISFSHGRYIALINVDDLLIPDQFDAVIGEFADETVDIIAFSAKMMERGRKKYYRSPRFLDSSLLFRTMPFSHNAAFISQRLYGNIGTYTNDFKIISDLHFFHRAHFLGAKVKVKNIPIIESELTGVSGTDTGLLKTENLRLLSANYSFLSPTEIENLFAFRMVYGGDRTYNFDCLLALSSIRKATRLGSALSSQIKTVINERPLNFVTKGFDLFLSKLPRNHESRQLIGTIPRVDESTENCPLITFGVTAFNCEDTIAATIDSLNAQTWPNYEIIIVDDASTDNTKEVIRKNISTRCRLLVNDNNKGVAYSRNRIAMASAGKYVMFCDDDDLSMPSRAVECFRAVRQVEAQHGTDQVICFTTRIAKSEGAHDITIQGVGYSSPVRGKEIRHYIGAHLLRVSGQTTTFHGLDTSIPYSLGTGVGMYPTKLIREVGFHESYRRAEDLEFALRCSEVRPDIYVVSTQESLYLQNVTKGEEKSKDIIFSFYCFLLIANRHIFEKDGIEVQKIAKFLVKKIVNEDLRLRFYKLLEFSARIPISLRKSFSP